MRYSRGVWLFWLSRDRTICLLHLPSGNDFHVRTFQFTVGGGDRCFGSFLGFCLHYASICHYRMIKNCTFIPSVYPSTLLYNGSVWKVPGSEVGRDAWYLEWDFCGFLYSVLGNIKFVSSFSFQVFPSHSTQWNLCIRSSVATQRLKRLRFAGHVYCKGEL